MNLRRLVCVFPLALLKYLAISYPQTHIATLIEQFTNQRQLSATITRMGLGVVKLFYGCFVQNLIYVCLGLMEFQISLSMQ